MPLTITYLGHSGFLFSDDKETLCVDPFLTGNPVAERRPNDIQCTHLAITHGHADHFGEDTLSIAKANEATVIAAFEICNYLQSQGIEKVEPGNPGGEIKTSFGFVAFTHAFHSSSYNGQYMGLPCGFVIEMGGKRIYHAGDTSLFSDMKLIGQIYKPDVAILPVGDRFTMGPEQAKMAAEFIGAPMSIPMHYKTFPLRTSDISAFKHEGISVRELQPGEALNL